MDIFSGVGWWKWLLIVGGMGLLWGVYEEYSGNQHKANIIIVLLIIAYLIYLVNKRNEGVLSIRNVSCQQYHKK